MVSSDACNCRQATDERLSRGDGTVRGVPRR